MKKILLLLLILPALACAITKPITPAQLGASLPTLTAIPSPTTTASPEICTVTAQSLNMRDAPTISGHVIAWLSIGDPLTLLPEPPAGDWVKVQFEKQSGWINSKFCEVHKP